MLRSPLPGEVWRIDAYQAHCLLTALERFTDFFHEDLLLWYWIQQFASDAVVYDPDTDQNLQAVTLITPTDKDPEFFERIIEKELQHLAYHDSTYKLSCGHEAREHETCLSDWKDQEIELAKKFASSREAVSRLPLADQIFGSGPFLSRADAERIIEEEVKRHILRRKMRDAESLRELESEEGQRLLQEAGLPPYNRAETIARMNRACQASAEDARAQLREIMEKYIVKE
ncbi:MAG: hypothetical protein A3A97_00820 [Candidatus Terrybacteria bacterium RIFCSPLOWO2_01_FULL_40_23]|uniref:Uncharacterized protein n=1 Tax=Candidatus Terrybacteria bacterium RIFCSPLOWO2_01_FULL_40_23 TaxID=1802366 RepID=A0A1G2PSS2_9BACT|nr:MAG: hypothetical protein A3A97_00820 [Candidatus Terrybacteria bacterium RIFCSPLOWO2_01_FULL_40_23]